MLYAENQIAMVRFRRCRDPQGGTILEKIQNEWPQGDTFDKGAKFKIQTIILKEFQLSNYILSDSNKYESLACDLVTNISRENPDLATILVRRNQPSFGHRSLIDAANFGDLLEFMGTSPVQEIISKMWFGGLEPEGRIGPFVCALFFPPIAPLLLEPTEVS